MPTRSIYKCPGCGASVELPPNETDAASPAPDECAAGPRREVLAQAVCGCWVSRLSDCGVAQLLRAVMTGDGVDVVLRPGATPGFC
jgi:hypothetical protein